MSAGIVGQVGRVNALIGDMSRASQEQFATVEQVSEAVGQLDQMTQRNAALAEPSTAAAGRLSDQARGLAEAVSAFRLAEDAGSAAEGLAQRAPDEGHGAMRGSQHLAHPRKAVNHPAEADVVHEHAGVA